jgi:hypothetical protein
MAALRHDVSIGFQGGQVLAVRLDEDAIKGLRSALDRDGWYEMSTEDGTAAVRLDKVVYVRVEDTEHRVGFG